MASPNFRNMRDSEVLKAVQPGITSDVDKYYIELAHSIVDNNSLYLGESATPEIGDLERDYESAKSDYEYEKTPKNEVAMIKANTKLIKAQTELLKERQSKMEPSKEMKSPILGIKTTTGGLHTRRRKHRNGPSGVRRHRSRRVSTRKVKARHS